jgi:hypothetical protein
MICDTPTNKFALTLGTAIIEPTSTIKPELSTTRVDDDVDGNNDINMT